MKHFAKNKNKKRNWRKLEKFIDADLHVAEKINQLQNVEPEFSLDTVRNLQLLKTAQKTTNSSVVKGDKRSILRNLRCFSDINLDVSGSKVPSLITKRLERKFLKKERKARSKMSSSSALITLNSSSCEGYEGDLDQDLWNSQPSTKAPVNEWVAPTLPKPVKLRNSVKIRSSRSLPSVEIPDPGTSYNPSILDHVSLLKTLEESELVRQRQEQKLAKQVDAFMLNKKDLEKVLNENLEDMGAYIIEDSNKTQESDGEVSAMPLLPLPPKSGLAKKRKAKQKLQKDIKRRKMKELESIDKLNKDLDNINDIFKEIHNDDQRTLLKKVGKQSAKLAKKKAVKKLGRTAYEAIDAPVKLSTELTSSLRELKPEGNFVMWQLNQLEKVGKIAPIDKRIIHHSKTKKYWKKGVKAAT